MMPYHGQGITVTAASGANIYLPDFNNAQLDTVYYVTRADAGTANLRVYGYGCQQINAAAMSRSPA